MGLYGKLLYGAQTTRRRRIDFRSCGQSQNEQREETPLEHAIVTDREKDEGEYPKTGDDWMAQYPTERRLEEVKQHVVDKAAHAQSSRNLIDIYSKSALPRKDHFGCCWTAPRHRRPRDRAVDLDSK